jgi:predicted DNA-binding transcriptional regulator YafY
MFDINDLVEECNKAIYNYTGINEGVKKRQVYQDIIFMESSQGWSVELKRNKIGRRVFFRYVNINFSINSTHLNQKEQQQIEQVLLTLSRFRGLPQFEWVEDIAGRFQAFTRSGSLNAARVMDFEQNHFLAGIRYMPEIFDAIVNKQVLQITYRPFQAVEPLVFIFHPYYIKQYNLRWFIFGLTTPALKITNLALDRIVSIQAVPTPYIENTEIDFVNYFEDVIGVTIPKGAVSEKILLLIAAERWPYIMTKPIHDSQKVIYRANDGVQIELDLIINPELIARILSYGADVKVLAPVHLTEMIGRQIQLLYEYYKYQRS